MTRGYRKLFGGTDIDMNSKLTIQTNAQQRATTLNCLERSMLLSKMIEEEEMDIRKKKDKFCNKEIDNNTSSAVHGDCNDKEREKAKYNFR